MKLKFGDIISFYFDSDTCWGTEGYHTGIILYDPTMKELRLYHLDEEMLNIRNMNLFDPATDKLDEFLEYWDVEDNIRIIGNIAMVPFEVKE